jgi:hypothetical protein
MVRDLHRTRFSHRRILLSLVLASSLAAPAARAQSKIPHAQLAQEFVVAHGIAETPPAAVKVDELLAKGFARFELGAFELHYPRAFLAEAPRVEVLRRLARGFIDLQMLCDALRSAEETAESKAAAKDAEALAKWIEGWKPKDLATAAASAGVELGASLPAKEPQRAAW